MICVGLVFVSVIFDVVSCVLVSVIVLLVCVNGNDVVLLLVFMLIVVLNMCGFVIDCVDMNFGLVVLNCNGLCVWL